MVVEVGGGGDGCDGGGGGDGLPCLAGARLEGEASVRLAGDDGGRLVGAGDVPSVTRLAGRGEAARAEGGR